METIKRIGGRKATVPLSEQKNVLVKFKQYFPNVNDLPSPCNAVFDEIRKALLFKMSTKAIYLSVKRYYSYFFDVPESKKYGVSSDAKPKENLYSNLCTHVPQTSKKEQKHPGVQCKECGDDVFGFRFICVECTDFDLCSDCEMIGTHGDHYMLRVPAHKPRDESALLVHALRVELQLVDRTVAEEEPIIKTEVKEEIPDPLENEEQIEVPQLVPLRPRTGTESEDSFMPIEIVKEEPFLERRVPEEEAPIEEISIEEMTIEVTPAPVADPPPQAPITMAPAFGKPMLVLHPLSVKPREESASPPLAPASKRPAPPPAADTVAGTFEVFSHSSASGLASTAKGNAPKKKR